MTFGERTKALRAARGMSLQDVADRAGISKTHVWNIEGDPDANPYLSTIHALSRAFGVSVMDLLGLDSTLPNLHPEAMRIAREIDQLLRRELP